MEKWQEEALIEIKKKMRIVDGGKICALYGLRRTGKTVMMNQCISELPPEEKEKSVYILCKEACDMLEVEQVIDDLYEKGKRFFFIDEVTLIEDGSEDCYCWNGFFWNLYGENRYPL